MPNILLLVVVLVGIFAVSLYIQHYGLGMFFRTTGIVFLVLGVIIFIFFLSIDPGYGWAKSLDLTKNYILIFTSLAVCVAGVVLIVIGQHVNKLHVQSMSENKRCQQLITGNVQEILEKEWCCLRDQKNQPPLSVYLFQKKTDRNNYKIIATLNPTGSTEILRSLTISSKSIPQPITVDRKDSVCPGVFEKNISIGFYRHHDRNEEIRFDLLLRVAGDTLTETDRGGQEETVQFSLKNKPQEEHENGIQARHRTKSAVLDSI